MTMRERVVTALAVTAAFVRLIPLHFLHPLNWDEIEFWRATRWIAEGRLPYRDFWEHHTPLPWFLFAPFTFLSDSPGVDAVILLRWAQIPLWIFTFWMLNVWMRDAGLERFARWSAIALALCASLFMIPAVEYRVDTLACALLVTGLVLVQRDRPFFAGVVFCLAAFANLRFAPVLAVAVLLSGRKMLRVIAGGIAALAVCLTFFAATHSLVPLYEQVWTDNRAERFAPGVPNAFVHRLLVPFGIRIIASDRLFELAAVDFAGIAVLVLGTAGAVLAFRSRGDVLKIVALGAANLVFVASMKYVYNYHFELVVILMVPLVALVFSGRRFAPVIALLAVAWSVNLFASVFRGKELDLAYQNHIMRTVDARTAPGDHVFSGISWALRREPSYRFWFLPELARQLVLHGEAPGYEVRDAPAAFVFDYNARVWIGTIQRELAPYFVRHYFPLWRELWIPAMNVRLRPRSTFEWTVPRDGSYRVYASPQLATHPWFRDPLGAAAYKGPDASRLTFRLGRPDAGPLQFSADVSRLRKGQRLTVTNPSPVTVGVLLLPTDDRILFLQPPPGATLEAETTRVTHVPHLGARFR